MSERLSAGLAVSLFSVRWFPLESSSGRLALRLHGNGIQFHILIQGMPANPVSVICGIGEDLPIPKWCYVSIVTMEGKKKLSGWQNKKRKAAKEEALKKQAGALYNYIKKAKSTIDNTQTEDIESGTSTSENVQLDEDQESTSTIELSRKEESLPITSTSQYPQLEENVASTSETSQDLYGITEEDIATGDETNQTGEETNLPLSSSHSLQLENPAKWPKITDKIRMILIEAGPIQKKNIVYPMDANRRKFSNTYYNRKMENGELLPRPWLVYSADKDCVFCFCCKLFSPSDTSGSSSFVSMGYNRWQSLSKALHAHETSLSHIQHLKTWYDLQKNLKNKSTLDSQNQRLFELEKKHWIDVITRLIEMIKYLGSQCLALIGSSDKIYQKNNGHFLKLVELFGKFDPVIATHIERTIRTESKVHYLSKDIQNEMIELLGNAITEKIVSSIKEARYFSIILDCTPDISHTEQMTVVIRFVSCKENNVLIEEHFLGFLEVDNSSGEGLCEIILTKMSSWNLNIENIRGQGYDNGANMRGKKIGLQKLILNKNPRAFYEPCAAHSLNLVVNDAAKVNCETVSFFGTVQEIFKFFSASVKRWGVLKKHISSLTLKPVYETRWESHIDALRPLRYQTGEIYDSLYEIFCDEKFDRDSRNQAKNFCSSLKDFQFLCSLVLWHDLLNHINPVSKMLQNAGENISIALTAIDNLRVFVSDYRTDASYESLLETSRQLCQDLDGEPQFKPASKICQRRKATQFDYEHADEYPQAPADVFRVNFFYTVLDVVMSSLKERFEQLQQHTNRFKFLYDLKNIAEQDKENLRQQCINLENHLSDGGNRDINGNKLFDELCAFRDLFSTELENLENPYEAIKFIHSNELSFPNLKIAFRILLTLPVSVASGERSFSRLKLIKNYLRSSISQERLVSLSMVAIECDVCDQLKIEELVSKFASMKARRAKWL
ncbi:zinc finger MYM-type protein 1-like [Pseudophryne corroboree]|uniref:zinc finger MYM-type protein 1-like n=1 Tax=Pseudophryne corroboree TaxID=495146 RepID=UPI0030812E56